MRLLPQEENRLLIFLAAELARKRRARGLLLSQAEAVALIADETLEAARDGLSYDEATAPGLCGLGGGRCACPGCGAGRPNRAGSPFLGRARLIVLTEPVLHDVPPAPAPEPALAWLDGASVVSRSRTRAMSRSP